MKQQSFFSVFPWGALKHFVRTVMWEVQWISRKEKTKQNKKGVPWGHIKIKWKDGTIILTAGGISKLLIKRLTMKNMKTQVSRGLLILCWYFEEIWLYGTIFKSHFTALQNNRGSTWTTWSSLRGQGKKPPCAGFHCTSLRAIHPWTKDRSLWELGDKIKHAHARPATTSGDLLP